jgi:energy-coupling factor transport system substrate-specific component
MSPTTSPPGASVGETDSPAVASFGTAVARQRTWRTVDIVVAAVLAVAFGVLFRFWGILWSAMDPVFAGFKPAGGAMYGVWLMAGVVGALIIRKPGAAIFVELIAAVVESLLGSTWGTSTVVYGFVQGLGAELIFLLFLYRRWTLPVTALAGAVVGVGAAVLDFVYYYAEWTAGWKIAHLSIVTASAAIVAGVVSWLLVRALAATGVLAPFPAGREQPTT